MGIERSEEYGALQRLVEALFRNHRYVTQLDLIIASETYDLCSDLREICCLVPPGRYARQRMCDQINSSIIAHGWGFIYGTVE